LIGLDGRYLSRKEQKAAEVGNEAVRGWWLSPDLRTAADDRITPVDRKLLSAFD